jgi:hypothetical protein
VKVRNRALVDRADELIGLDCLRAGPGSLVACVCSHDPDQHVPDAGCIVLVGDALDTFCPCENYEVDL